MWNSVKESEIDLLTCWFYKNLYEKYIYDKLHLNALNCKSVISTPKNVGLVVLSH